MVKRWCKSFYLLAKVEFSDIVTRLADLVVRTEVNKVVNDLVNLDRVRSLLMTISERRRFLAILENKRKLKQTENGTHIR